MADPQMRKLCDLRSQEGLNVAQTFVPRKLGEGHALELLGIPNTGTV